ncbi:MAG TPA: hypothetical protein VKT78_09685 [Fimbriimonadaceae bacterium]|nr:hypothetical protein [Fimbriimonadaceae bacterium]
MERLNANLERDVRSRGSWKIALRNGIVGAIGGLIASSVLIAILVHFSKPLQQISELRPTLERLAQQQSGRAR